MGQHMCKIGGPVRAVLVGAEVQADHRVGGAVCKARGDCLHAVIVEPEPVDCRAVLAQPEQARPGVAGLGTRRGGACFEEAETGARQALERGGVLVKAGGQANRVGQGDPGQRGFEAR